MTRKDFEMLARRINASLFARPDGAEAVLALARELADDLSADDPRFNRQRFLLACTKGTGMMPE